MNPDIAKRWKSLLVSALLSTILIGGGLVAVKVAGPAPSAAPAANKLSNTAAVFLAEQLRKGRKPNRLIQEKSPYLLQHAFNPVDWHPWGEAAFEKARQENKPIFLSIGYSTCYWCHVMEREVFENQEIAALMNRYFVCIKVDREERPDVDRVYMAALLAMAGSGGWPMSMFLTPDRKPFYGASYIPPAEFRDLAGQIHEAWTKDRKKVLQSGQKLTEHLKRGAGVEAGKSRLGQAILTKGFEQFRQGYDQRHGGFGGRPKFPRPVGLNFLLRYHHRTRNPEALEMTLATLRKMAQGGVYDHLGGGFHRYSVDRQWRVPHFEKMLYDQALLAGAYLDAYTITREEFFASIARQTLAYAERNLKHPEGGFYSAEDAESAMDPGKPEEKEEGAFFVWRKGEIEGIIGKQQAEIFSYAYGVEGGGNAPEDPHKVFTGRNILYAARSTGETARKFNISETKLAKLLSASRSRLFAAREKRPRPHLDDKILVSWNGLMISAFVRASQALDDPSYLGTAKQAAGFILDKLYDPKTGRLLRRYREGDARHEAQLEDYAFFIRGLLDLYEGDLDIRWLEKAIELAERQNARFYDQKDGGFFDTDGDDDTLLFRTKESYDGAEPTGNAIATWNLLRLAQMTNHPAWRALAERTLVLFGERLEQAPESMPQMLAALDFQLDKPKQIILAGVRGRADLQAMLAEAHRRYLPNKIVLLADGGAGQQYLSRSVPFLETVTMRGGKATAYICENYACKLPTADAQVMAKLLEGGAGN